MRSSWNDDEDAALHELPWEAQILYLRCFRRHMDYATGIVGIKHRLAKRRVCSELLRVPVMAGSHRECQEVTLDGLRALLKLLADRGLIRRLREYPRQFVFFLPLADFDDKQVVDAPSPDDSDPMRNARGTQEERNTSSAPPKPSAGTGSEGSSARGTQYQSGKRNASYPLTVNRLSKKIAAALCIPREAVEPIVSGLLRCFSDDHFHGVLESAACQRMVGQWVQQGVTGDDVGEVYRAVQSRTAKSFGPVYLQGPMADLLAERGVRVERGAEVDELKQRRDVVQLNARRELLRPHIAEVVASPVGVYVHGAGMVMESELIQLGLIEGREA